MGAPISLPTDLQTHAWRHEVEVPHPGSPVPALLLGPSHFSEGRTPGAPVSLPTRPRYSNPQRPGLTTCRPGTECLLFRVQFLSAPRRRKGKLGGWGGGRKPGSDPRPLPPLEPRASALLGQGRLCEIPEGPGRRGLGAAGEGWGLTVSPSVRLSVPQATTLSLESTLPLKGCSTPLWERRNECSPWLPARVGTPWSARHPMPTPSDPGPSHRAHRGSGAHSVLPLHCCAPHRLLLHPPLLSSTF